MARQSAARPARGRAARGRRSKLETAHEDQVPDVYQEMLEEAEARDPGQFHSDRPIKRRRVGDSKSIQTRAIPVDSPPLEQANAVFPPGEDISRNVQTVYDSTTSDESDVEWEDVDVAQHAQGLFSPKQQHGRSAGKPGRPAKHPSHDRSHRSPQPPLCALADAPRSRRAQTRPRLHLPRSKKTHRC